METVRLAAVSEAMKELFVAPPRCECCYESRHVMRDGYGGVAVVCARCEYQVRATGCCRLHNSRMYYSELAQGTDAVPTPPDIEALFAVVEPERPKYDPAELVDADI